MPAIQIPGTNITYGWQEREEGWGPGMNANLLVMGQVARGSVLTRSETDPPSNPSEGDAYLVPVAATGLWSGRGNNIAAFHSDAWVFIYPMGTPILVEDEGVHVYWNGSAYLGLTGTGDVTGVSSSDDGEMVVFSGSSGKSIKGSPLRVDGNGSFWGHGAKIKVIAATSYTVLGEDCGKVLWFASDTDVTVTLPQTSTEAIPVGMQAAAIQGGEGVVTFQEEGAEAIVASGSLLSTAGKGAPVSFMRQADGVWWLGGERA